VVVNGTFSKWSENVLNGVPQRLVLGPLLFIIYNDIDLGNNGRMISTISYLITLTAKDIARLHTLCHWSQWPDDCFLMLRNLGLIRLCTSVSI